MLLSEPLKWGERLTVMDLDLVREPARLAGGQSTSTVLNANTVPEDPAIVQLVTQAAHEAFGPM